MVAVISWWALDGSCHFLVGSGWLLFPVGLWMVPVISWWALHGFCYFLVGSGWLLLFPSGLWMVAISCWALDGSCYFLVTSGWLLLFPAGLCMVAVISWWALDGYCHFLVGSAWLLLFPVWMARRLHDTEVINRMVNHHRVAEALYQKTQLDTASHLYVTFPSPGGSSKEMTFSDTDTTQKVLMSSTSLTCSSPERCGTRRSGAKKAGVAQAGGQERNLQVFIFITHPALSDPLGAWASSPPPPVGQEGETCLPRHPAIKQHLFNQERMVHQKKKKKKICKEVLSEAPCV